MEFSVQKYRVALGIQVKIINKLPKCIASRIPFLWTQWEYAASAIKPKSEVQTETEIYSSRMFTNHSITDLAQDISTNGREFYDPKTSTFAPLYLKETTSETFSIQREIPTQKELSNLETLTK